MLIRREATADVVAIARVHAGAFAAGPGEPVEVELVHALRRSDAWLPRLSLVAVDGERVVGHVVCSRARLEPGGRPVLGLGPIGVLPEGQGRGVGAALMHAVLGAADACDETLVGVLGEPAYYRRFGFEPAAQRRVVAPDASWGAYFQVRVLSRWQPGLHGRFRYAAPFEGL
jgi:putative acetyltransferase